MALPEVGVSLTAKLDSRALQNLRRFKRELDDTTAAIDRFARSVNRSFGSAGRVSQDINRITGSLRRIPNQIRIDTFVDDSQLTNAIRRTEGRRNLNVDLIVDDSRLRDAIADTAGRRNVNVDLIVDDTQLTSAIRRTEGRRNINVDLIVDDSRLNAAIADTTGRRNVTVDFIVDDSQLSSAIADTTGRRNVNVDFIVDDSQLRNAISDTIGRRSVNVDFVVDDSQLSAAIADTTGRRTVNVDFVVDDAQLSAAIADTAGDRSLDVNVVVDDAQLTNVISRINASYTMSVGVVVDDAQLTSVVSQVNTGDTFNVDVRADTSNALSTLNRLESGRERITTLVDADVSPARIAIDSLNGQRVTVDVVGNLVDTLNRGGSRGISRTAGFAGGVVGGVAGAAGIDTIEEVLRRTFGSISGTLESAIAREVNLASTLARAQEEPGSPLAQRFEQAVTDIALDRSLQVDSAQVFEASEKLTAQGVNLTQQLEGSLRAAIVLQNATGANQGVAAELFARARNASDLAGEQLSDAEIVNSLIALQQSTQLDIQGINQLFGAGGIGVTRLGGLENFLTLAAVVAPFTAGGSDLGTSLKSFTSFIDKQTAKAQEALLDVGLLEPTTGQNRLFEGGQLLPPEQLIATLQGALGGLTQQELTEFGGATVGQDAVRALEAIVASTELTRAGFAGNLRNVDAEQIAERRNLTTSGRREALADQIQTISEQVGGVFLDDFGNFLDSVGEFAEKVGPLGVENAQGIAERVGPILDSTGDFLGKVADLSVENESVLTGLDLAVDQTFPRLGKLFEATGELIGGIRDLGGAITPATDDTDRSAIEDLTNVVRGTGRLLTALSNLTEGVKLGDIDQFSLGLIQLTDSFQTLAGSGSASLDAIQSTADRFSLAFQDIGVSFSNSLLGLLENLGAPGRAAADALGLERQVLPSEQRLVEEQQAARAEQRRIAEFTEGLETILTAPERPIGPEVEFPDRLAPDAFRELVRSGVDAFQGLDRLRQLDAQARTEGQLERAAAIREANETSEAVLEERQSALNTRAEQLVTELGVDIATTLQGSVNQVAQGVVGAGTARDLQRDQGQLTADRNLIQTAEALAPREPVVVPAVFEVDQQQQEQFGPQVDPETLFGPATNFFDRFLAGEPLEVPVTPQIEDGFTFGDGLQQIFLPVTPVPKTDEAGLTDVGDIEIFLPITPVPAEGFDAQSLVPEGATLPVTPSLTEEVETEYEGELALGVEVGNFQRDYTGTLTLDVRQRGGPSGGSGGNQQLTDSAGNSGNRTGSLFWSGGPTRIAEANNPELLILPGGGTMLAMTDQVVNLPAGTQILSADNTQRALGVRPAPTESSVNFDPTVATGIDISSLVADLVSQRERRNESSNRDEERRIDVNIRVDKSTSTTAAVASAVVRPTRINAPGAKSAASAGRVLTGGSRFRGSIGGGKGFFSPLAEGTMNAPAGLALVGEAGREFMISGGNVSLVDSPTFVNMRGGEQVLPNSITERIISAMESVTTRSRTAEIRRVQSTGPTNRNVDNSRQITVNVNPSRFDTGSIRSISSMVNLIR